MSPPYPWQCPLRAGSRTNGDFVSEGGERIHNRFHGSASLSVQVGDVHGPLTIIAPASRDQSPPRDVSDLPRVRDYDPFMAGVHRARTEPNLPPLPHYVRRDRDTELEQRLIQTRTRGGLVLVVGPSTSGKTRAVWEAAQKILPDHHLLYPSADAALHHLRELTTDSTPPWLLWLEDLERYLRPGGLDPETVHRLLRSGVPIVATMRTLHHEEFSRGHVPDEDDDVGATEARTVGTRILGVVTPVHLAREWSPGELARARASSDPRLAEAHRHSAEFGIAEYLASGPELLSLWRNARRPTSPRERGHPRGHALVSAAVDLGRAGLTNPVSVETLKALHVHYLSVQLRPEDFDSAWRWATEQRFGAAGLLVPGDFELATWRAFDYLLEAEYEHPVPDPVWDAALGLTDDERAWVVGRMADRAGKHDIATQAWRRAARSGDVRAMRDLGRRLTWFDETAEEGRRWSARAAEADDRDAQYLLGFKGLQMLGESGLALLRELSAPGGSSPSWTPAQDAPQGRDRSAFELLRRAGEQGHVDAALHLAFLHDEAVREPGTDPNAETTRRHREERLRWLRTAAEGGSGTAHFTLAEMAITTGDRTTARERFEAAAAAGVPEAAHRLARWCEEQGDGAGAVHWNGRAYELGSLKAAYTLAHLARAEGDADLADHWLRRALRRPMNAEVIREDLRKRAEELDM